MHGLIMVGVSTIAAIIGAIVRHKWDQRRQPAMMLTSTTSGTPNATNISVANPDRGPVAAAPATNFPFALASGHQPESQKDAHDFDAWLQGQKVKGLRHNY